ncbi:NAD(P)/FAD-dependent oxidoreductase [Tepidamorphus sp. 3E244]|uniref:NAD(P)/FAD-dependent oxidoreductase n=1 Tax=Tepidamorphus sp. 3E244 TaxID=3385498 RepID=UPI0038FC9024
MRPLKIAVIGSGISGLSAAWLLSKTHNVTLYETDDRLGGHANTTHVDMPDGTVAVDTGFIVYNELTYPNLTALFAHLDVPTQASSMGFSFSSDAGAYEYSGTGANGFFGQRRNLLKKRHWRMLSDIKRFFETATTRVTAYDPQISLGAFLATEGYSTTFIDEHIVPMGAAIWSTPAQRMLDFPARAFVDFYDNHRLLQFNDQPVWRTVRGGSREYVQRICDDGDFEIVQGVGARAIRRTDTAALVEDARGAVRPFDQVVIATQADQALGLLDAPADEEARLLGAFAYQENLAILHSDRRLMPKRRRIWSAWNFLKSGAQGRSELCLTYWMNELQSLDTRWPVLVTLNPYDEVHPKAEHGRFAYRHAVFDNAALTAQKDLWSLQGQKRTWFCGSYFGYGFHEDGLQAGLAVAEAIGGVRRPWYVDNESGRIHSIRPRDVRAAE